MGFFEKLKSGLNKTKDSFDEKINKQWINSTNYQIKDSIKIELYKDNYCYTYLLIKIS